MRFSKYLAAAAAASLAVAPAMAAPASSATSLSVGGKARAGSHTGHDNDALGGGILIALIAAVAVIAGVVAIASNNDKPASP